MSILDLMNPDGLQHILRAAIVCFLLFVALMVVIARVEIASRKPAVIRIVLPDREKETSDA